MKVLKSLSHYSKSSFSHAVQPLAPFPKRHGANSSFPSSHFFLQCICQIQRLFSASKQRCANRKHHMWSLTLRILTCGSPVMTWKWSCPFWGNFVGGPGLDSSVHVLFSGLGATGGTSHDSFFDACDVMGGRAMTKEIP